MKVITNAIKWTLTKISNKIVDLAVCHVPIGKLQIMNIPSIATSANIL